MKEIPDYKGQCESMKLNNSNMNFRLANKSELEALNSLSPGFHKHLVFYDTNAGAYMSLKTKNGKVNKVKALRKYRPGALFQFNRRYLTAICVNE